MKSRVFGCVAVAALLSSLAAAQGRTVGSFTVARNVTYSLSGNDNFLVANPHDGVRDGSLVRSGKRAFGEIQFNDSSILRINERTDLVVHDSANMRRIALNSGAVWIKVKTGTHTAVQTPVGTATARGTVFLVGSSGYLHVIEGTVELADPDSKKLLLVHAGETALIGATGLPQMAQAAGVGGTGEPGGTGDAGGVDLVGVAGKEGFPKDWYMSQGELFGSYTDAGGTSDQGIAAPLLFWHPWMGLVTLGTGLLIHSPSGGSNGGGSGPVTPEPGTVLIVSVGLGALARARSKRKREQI